MKMKLSYTSLCLALGVVLAVVIKEGLAIKCWDCRSDADPKCADPFDNTTFAITDCAQAPRLKHLNDMPATMCRKIRQKFNGVWKYIRSCAYLGEVGMYGDERYCLMRTGTYNIFMEYCTCDSKDGCNGSGILKHSPVIIFSSILFVPFFIRMMR